MPIAEFLAVISPESILRDGTGDFSARRATDGSHDGQISQNANSNTAISAHHATRKSRRGQILPDPGTRPTTTRPPSDRTIAPRADTAESRRPLNAIGTPCDRKVAQQTDTSRIQHQAGGICPPCDWKSTRRTVTAGPRQPGDGICPPCAHAAAPRADSRLQATDRQPPVSTRPPHDGNKERPASNNDGRPERHHRPGRPSSRPPDGHRQSPGIHPASSHSLPESGCGQARSGLLKRLIEVGNQIIRILNAHGQTHQVRRNLKCRPGHRSVGHGRRQLNQGFHAAE